MNEMYNLLFKEIKTKWIYYLKNKDDSNYWTNNNSIFALNFWYLRIKLNEKLINLIYSNTEIKVTGYVDISKTKIKFNRKYPNNLPAYLSLDEMKHKIECYEKLCELFEINFEQLHINRVTNKLDSIEVEFSDSMKKYNNKLEKEIKKEYII